MPASTAADIGRMTEAFGIVAAVAVPVGLAAWALGRRSALFGWRRWQTGWTGFDVSVFAFVYFFLSVQKASIADFRLVAAANMSIAVIFTLAVRRWPNVPHGALPRFDEAMGSVRRGVVAWVVIAPTTLTVHFLANHLYESVGGVADKHPLTSQKISESAELAVLFFLSVCVAGPLCEELLFRRALIPWATGRRYRPWILAGCATLIGGKISLDDGKPGPFAFAVVCAGLLAVVPQLRKLGVRTPVRTLSAVGSSSVVFAVLHAPIWPSPVPLLVLGIGLGWVALRTRGVIAPTVCHGLFNAVSTVYLLRNPGE